MEVTIRIGSESGSVEMFKTYLLVQTNAPRTYDYDVIELADVGDINRDGKGVRLVLIRKDNVDTQIQRYMSGLYQSYRSDLNSDADGFEFGHINYIIEILSDRLYQRNID